MVSRDNVFEIQISHLRPFKSVSEKRVLESEFLSGSPDGSYMYMLQFENHLLWELHFHYSILAFPSGICRCESYKKVWESVLY